MNAREIVKALGGRGGMARCPAHNDKNPSLAVRDAPDGRVLVHCHSGCTQSNVIVALQKMGLWPERDRITNRIWKAPQYREPPAPVSWHTDDAPPEMQRACDIWRRFCGAFGPESPAGRYLLGRGIPPPWPETLAAGTLRHPETREIVPALIVARQCPTVGLVRGIQRIFLTGDGAKYPDGTVKMSLGSIDGGRAELIFPDTDLMIAEGVESALSAWRMFRTPAWAICGSFPREIKLPTRVSRVQIVADHDAHGTSQSRAKVLARWLRSTGRTCTVLMPAAAGRDANDVARELRHAG